MTVSTGTSAGNFWEDGFEDESDCERFLQEQKTKIIEDEEEHGVAAEYDEEADAEEDDENDDQDAETEEADTELVAEADESDDAEEVSEEEDEEETEPVAEVEETEATNPEKGRKMTRTKTKAGGKTKAEAIREVIDRRKRAGDSLRPRDIIEELSENGFEVNASQVSVTLRSMGVPPAPKGRVKGSGAKAKPVAPPAEPKSRMALKRGTAEKDKKASRDGHVGDMSATVQRAVELYDEAGGYEMAKEALDLVAKIRSV